MSLICFLSDDMEVQMRLPQILIANERTLTAMDDARLRKMHTDRPNFLVLRRKSAWCNKEFVKTVLELVAERLKPLKNIFVKLLIDCCPCHCSETVVKAARQSKLALHYVPSGLTGIMQPLDVYFFGPFKQQLEAAYHTHRIVNNNGGTIPVIEQIKLLDMTLFSLLESRCWQHAFSRLGYDGSQRELGSRLLNKLKWATSPGKESDDLPDLSELQQVWMNNRDLPLDNLLYEQFEVPHPPPAKRYKKHSKPAEPDIDLDPMRPWHGRLRSSSSHAAVSATQPPPHTPAIAVVPNNTWPSLSPVIAAPQTVSTNATTGDQPLAPPPLPPPMLEHEMEKSTEMVPMLPPQPVVGQPETLQGMVRLHRLPSRALNQ